MATQYSNKPIVTDGLVYALDFGNPKSYVSGSSVARSLTFTPTSGSFVGNLESASLEGGLLHFNTNPGFYGNNAGTKVVLSNKSNFSALAFGKEFTISFVIKTSTDTGFQTIFSGEPNGYTGRIGFTVENNVYKFGLNYTPTGVNALGRHYPAPNNTLEHRTVRYSSGSWDHFINGIPVTASNVGTYGNSSNPGLFTINGRGTSLFENMFSGSLGLLHLYDRALTSDEIWNNYQLTAPRYGLGPLENKPYNLDENAYLFLQSAGITDPIITGSIDTFVRGLKSNNLWDKMIAIYPFVGTGSDGVNLTGSHKWNLKEPSLVTYPLSFTGSWNGSTSGSAPSGSNTNISTQVAPSNYYPFYNTQSAHISILSYDTPVSSSYLMGTGMTEDLAISTLAGDYGTPAAAYSVRKVRTAYSGALMDVRRSIDNVTQSIGYVSNGDLDTGSLLDWTIPGRNDLPGEYEGLAAAYSLRKVSASYDGYAIDVRRIWDNTTSSIGFDVNGNLDTGLLLNFTTSGSNIFPYSNDFTQADWAKYNIQVTSSAILGPYGLGSGSFINETIENNIHVFNEDIDPVNTSSIHTISCFVKKQERRYVGLAFAYNGANNTAVTFDLDTTSSVATSSIGTGYSVISSSINYVTDGWFRISLISTVGLTTLGPRFYLTTTSAANSSPIYTGEPGTGSYIYGFQYTTGSTVQPYIETTGTARYNVGNTSSFGYVTQWYDQSGNNRHATQTATGSQPLIVSSGSLVTENGKPALSFDGTSTNLKSDIFTSSLLPYTTFTAVKFNTFTSFNFIVSHGNELGVLASYNPGSGQTFWAKNNVNLFGGGTAATNTPYLLYALFNNTSSEIASNGNIATTGSTGTFTWSTITIGSDTDNEGGTFINGTVSEHLEYYANQSSNRPLIENNINNYYNIYTGSNHGFVARWYDQSGNNRHATQTATGSQPMIVLSGSILTTNNKPNLNFDGVDDNFSLVSTISSNTAYTAIEVNRRTDTSVNSVGFATTSGQPYVNLFLATTLYFSTLRLGTGYFGTYSINSTDQQLLFSIDDKSSNLKSYLNQNLVINSLSSFGTATFTDYNNIGIRSGYTKDVKQELIFYSSDQSSNREAISYGINNYYNIYPQTSSFATSSFTIQATPTAISGAINNKLTSGIPSSGPLGLITVSRTGSNSLTIARNGAVTSFTTPASGALSTGIYLGAINNNGLALGNSPLNLSFASVGTGLTGADVNNLSALTLQLQYRLTSRRLPPISNGLLLNLDASSKTSYPGSGSIWFDISGNNYNGNLVNGAIFDPLNEGSLVFNGINNYVLNTSFNITPVNNELAISMWYKTANNANEKMLIDLCSNSNRDLFSIRQNWNSTNKITCYFKSTTGFQAVDFPNQVITNTWNNIVYSKVGNTINAYLNGELVNTSSVTGNIQTIQRYVIANDNLLASNLFSGNIANVLIYNRGLSPQEVLQNFNTNRVRFGV
jgi:hypothetical protein